MIASIYWLNNISIEDKGRIYLGTYEKIPMNSNSSARMKNYEINVV